MTATSILFLGSITIGIMGSLVGLLVVKYIEDRRFRQHFKSQADGSHP